MESVWAETPPEQPPEAPTPSAPAEPPIVPPRALGSLAVAYPDGAEGEAEVVVELSIDELGAVIGATAIDAAPPFSTAAEQAALTWRFEPARRAGLAVPVRIRVLVSFTPPVYEELPDEAETPSEDSEPRAATAVPETDSAKELEPVEVVIQGERVPGVKKLAQADVRQLPGAFGDPYRAIEVLPGVTPIASGLPYFFIRGAPPGNVGYFFDGVPVPLLFHVAAGPGVLHPAFVKSVDLYSGAYPVRFGRYAGGIVSGEAEDPEMRFRGEASIRIVDSGAFLEIPFAEGRGSAMLAGRYSYTGLIVSLLAPDVTLGYWDYQSRISYDFTPEDRISVFGFGSHDYLSANNTAGVEQEVLDLTFHRLDTRYTRRIDASSELDLTLSLGLDRTGVGGDPDEEEEDPADLRSRMVGLRADFETQILPTVRLRTGADARLSRFDVDINPPEPGEEDDDDDPEQDDPESAPLTDRVLPAPGFPEVVLDPVLATAIDQGETTFNERFLQRDDLVSGVWLDAVIDAGSGVTLTPGFRFDVYDNGSELAYAPEPRIAARFDLSETVSLFHDLGIAHQPPSFAIPIPGLSGAGGAGLQRALQSSAGVETRLPSELTATVTLFQNVIMNSTDIFGVGTLQEADASSNAFTTRTTAHSYGAEFLLQRSLSQRIGGLISYTLARSTRSVTRLHGPSSFDRRHVLNGALAFNLGRRWRLGTRGMVYSGIPAQVYYPEATKNPPRTPFFYRFDWRLEKQWLIGNEGAWWALVFEVLNTTLNKEVLTSSCYAYGCVENYIGPVTIPSIGVEASF